MEDKKYQIYRFYAKWNQVDYENNFTSCNIMYKEPQTEDDLNNALCNFKNKLIEDHITREKIITDFIESNYEYVEDESWCLTWFSHYTYNQFETDAEVSDSFYQFLCRKKVFDNYNQTYCAMGAEDMWRWKICRCEHCVAQGVIRIDH
jgi:hypothetical protein